MIHLLHSGKFWLKLITFGILALVIFFIIIYISLQQLFSTERIQSLANRAIEGTGRTIQFSDINRSWFPRPTATLHNIIVTEPNSASTAMIIKEMRVGLAWGNLWSKRLKIEKWSIKEAKINIEQDNNNQWNLQDLLNQSNGQLELNRLIVEDSTLHITTPNYRYNINHFSAKTRRIDEDTRQFNINGQFDTNLNQQGLTAINWQADGNIIHEGKTWQIPTFNATANSTINQHPFHINLNSKLNWDQAQQLLTAQNTRLRADSSFQNLHITAEIPQIKLADNQVSINRINGIYTMPNDHLHYDGTLILNNTNISPNTINIDEFETDNNIQTSNYRTTANATGQLQWQKNKSLNINNLSLTTLQDSLSNKPSPTRFNAQLSGAFELLSNLDFNAQLQGTFDQQSTNITANYHHKTNKQPARLKSNLTIEKLTLIPYLAELKNSTNEPFPYWLGYSWVPEINSSINIKTLATPNLELTNIKTNLFANNNRITLSNFSANLYDGKTEGGLSINHTQPVSYHLQQNATNVQIGSLLQDLFEQRNITGNGQAVIDLTTKGVNRQELIQNLNGNLQLTVSNGAWLGFDLNNILQHAGNNTLLGNKKSDDRILKTPFHHFTMLSKIKNGISHHENIELTSDVLTLNSTGQTDLNNQTLSENVLIYNTRNPKAKPIPLKITGKLDNPSITVDFQRLTYGLTTPEEKQKALEETIREQWQWLNPLNHQTPKNIKPSR